MPDYSEETDSEKIQCWARNKACQALALSNRKQPFIISSEIFLTVANHGHHSVKPLHAVSATASIPSWDLYTSDDNYVT